MDPNTWVQALLSLITAILGASRAKEALDAESARLGRQLADAQRTAGKLTADELYRQKFGASHQD